MSQRDVRVIVTAEVEGYLAGMARTAEATVPPAADE